MTQSFVASRTGASSFVRIEISKLPFIKKLLTQAQAQFFMMPCTNFVFILEPLHTDTSKAFCAFRNVVEWYN
ncbi:hypothetical protein HY641_00195 [Candidatus Woesearchaeota archaeon]|nr:hypothetical protein [Candidatus Woesearchaeota archaeon]